jgi:hypothetical protein
MEMPNMFSAVEPKPSYWFDTSSFIDPSRLSHRFNWGTKLWDFLAEKAREHVIGSPSIVLTLELTPSDKGKADDLAKWALDLDGILFLPPDRIVQKYQSETVQYVSTNPQYSPPHIQAFCGKADTWVIAYARAHGGKIVTFEKSAPFSKEPKIPDIAKALFDVDSIILWDALDELGYHE